MQAGVTRKWVLATEYSNPFAKAKYINIYREWLTGRPLLSE
jgi:hypothetical protein